MTLGGEAYELVGVTPRGFTLGDDEALWVPLDLAGTTADVGRARKQHYLRVIARLKPGVALDAARRDASAVARRLEAQYPETNAERGLTVSPLHEEMS